MRKKFQLFNKIFNFRYFGFVEGHNHHSIFKMFNIFSFIFKKNKKIRTEYELNFASLIGKGRAFSYASCRMAFFNILQAMNVSKGDEVIILGHTCSVMVNAILRTGATPVFSDIDERNFGSCPHSIKSKISKKTKVILAQHSFGIPCDIVEIQKIAQAHKVFLIEDCALTLSSKIKNKSIGCFGDAALFSTDHSKPINTLIGGIAYSTDSELIKKIEILHDNCPEIPVSKQIAIIIRIFLERFFCDASRNGLFAVMDLFCNHIYKKFPNTNPFLEHDSGLISNSPYYYYPSKLPVFLSVLGIYELQRWNKNKEERVRLLESSKLALSKQRGIKLPEAYFDKSLEIVPLRIIFTTKERDELFKSDFKNFINISWTWFMRPIVCASVPLSSLGYEAGSCPKSEKACAEIANIPWKVPTSEYPKIFDSLNSITKAKFLDS